MAGRINALLLPSCRTIYSAQGALFRCNGAGSTCPVRPFSTAETEQPAAGPQGDGDESSSTQVSVSASGADAGLKRHIIDEAVKKITLNLGLKTETLVAHGVGVTEALNRQHQLHFGMMLAARRKAMREGKDKNTYAGLTLSEAFQKSLKQHAV